MLNNSNIDPSPRKAVHSGIVRLGSFELRVHVLDNGATVIEEDSLIAFHGWLESGCAGEEEMEPVMIKIFQRVDDWEPIPDVK